MLEAFAKKYFFTFIFLVYFFVHKLSSTHEMLLVGLLKNPITSPALGSTKCILYNFYFRFTVEKITPIELEDKYFFLPLAFLYDEYLPYFDLTWKWPGLT